MCEPDTSPEGQLAERLDAALARTGGEPTIRALALAHGASCIGRFDAVEHLYRYAIDQGVELARLEETALQVVAYGGFPRAIEGLGILARLRDGPAASAPLDEAPSQDRGSGQAHPTTDEPGRRTWDAIYRHSAGDVIATLEGLVPGFSRWVLEDAYARILSRPTLTLGVRELLAVSALGLAALPGPLGSHLRGALRNGSTPDTVDDILRTSLVLAAPRARSVIDQARDRLARKVYRT